MSASNDELQWMHADSFPELPWVRGEIVKLTGYAEIMEVLRSPAMGQQLIGEDAPFRDGVLNTLNGKEHVRRRRLMNRLLNPNAVEFYRDQVLLPILQDQLRTLALDVDGDGVCRVDLVTFTKSTLIRLAAKLVGVEVPDDEDAARLIPIVNAIAVGAMVKFQLGDHQPLIERALAAKEAFRTTYYQPALAKCPAQQSGEGSDLMSLLAAGADPDWRDDDLKLRESTSMLIASVGTTAGTLTYTIDELHRWFVQHPDERAFVNDLGFLSRAIEETLRLHPLGPTHTRIALDDVTLSTGRIVKKGQWVVGSKLAANCDDRFFGPDALSFNPHREIAPTIPRYATSFGAGPHQCIGLRLVLGNGDDGPGASALRVLFAAGVEPDTERPAVHEPTLQGFFAAYPVIFRHVPHVTAAVNPQDLA
jgi:cytochrome P450